MLNRKEQEPGARSRKPEAPARPVLTGPGPQQQQSARRSGVLRAPYLLLAALCCLFFVASCRMDMQDQPKYKVYRSSNFFKDGLSSRPLPEGAVARGQLRADAALYTGKIDKAQAGQSASGGQTTQGQQNQDGRGMGQPAQGQSGGANSGGGSGTNTGGAGANIYEGDVDAFPFPITEEVVNRGQERYQIFCSICHGMSGYGDGMIVRRGFRKPSSYYEDNLRKAPVGHYYDVITNGWGSMPNYAAQIPVQDRWAIVAYIRALQLTVPPGPPNGNTGAPQTTPQQQSQSQSQPSQPQPAASQTPKTGGQR